VIVVLQVEVVLVDLEETDLMVLEEMDHQTYMHMVQAVL
tara:strand:+ start:171 stop:287 length:117 start_codon:yes stop_codon:yes gene_type:complete